MKKLLLILLLASAPALAQKITATSWLVADGEGKIIESVNADQQRSIASITKLMTAMVILDAEQDLNEKLKKYTRNDLLQLMLIKSDNLAAETLCQHYPSGRSGCIDAMNKKVEEIGLVNTRFSDPSGLGIMNISTANDLIKIVLEAGKYPDIVHASNTAQASVKEKKNLFYFNNTNPLVATRNFIVSKTGYIRASGGCIVMMLDTELGRRIVILLNSKSTRTRIPEARLLASSF